MLSRFKRRIGIITAVAVVAALVPALSMSPASAAVNALTAEVVSSASTYSACPTGSAPAAGFTDTTSTDVDCIKMHGITTGVTATTYEPASNIPRWQMALYLTRFMTSGAYTLGSGADQGFTDISGYAADIQTAINQLAQSTVTLGTTATTFSPDDNVTREQMAMFIDRMLNKVVAGPGGSSVTTTVINSAIGGYNYTDIDSGAVTFEGHNSILEIFELGVTGDAVLGAVGITYRPAADITRAEMATFLTNALGHTNARPEGLWLQGSIAAGFGAVDTQLHVSHRDASRAPITGTLVDVFSGLVTVLTSTPSFGATGACTTVVADNDMEGGATECAIALGDASTNLYGNVAVNPTDTASGTTRDYWAWTGATGALYNNLTAPGKTVQTVSSLPQTYMAISEDIPANALADTTDANYMFVPFGTNVVVTGQLKNALFLSTARAAVVVSVTETTTVVNDAGTAYTTVNANSTDVMTSAKTTALLTDANGAISYTITSPVDPGATAAVVTNRTHVIAAFTTPDAAVNADAVSGINVKVAFNDDAAYDASVTLTQGSYYGTGLTLVQGGVARTASATVWDQYGAVRTGRNVTFEQTTDDGGSDNLNGAVGDGDSFTDDVIRVSDSSGVATLGFTDTNVETAMHTVWAWIDTATNVGTRGDSNEPQASSVFYRLEATPTTPFNEIDTGEAVEVSGNGLAFTVEGDAGTGVWTSAGNPHAQTIGMSVVVSTACTGGGATIKVGEVFYVISITGNGGTEEDTFAASYTRGGAIADPTAADETGCQIQPLETWAAGDVFGEIDYWDDANNTLVIREQTTAVAAGAYDWFAFTYEADDQFMTSGDNALQPLAAAASFTAELDPIGATLAAFETGVKAKMTLASGYTRPKANTPALAAWGDIFHLTAKNHLADPGVSVIHLGQ